jgi:Polyketide cyclase / dehydrase and lipid transport
MNQNRKQIFRLLKRLAIGLLLVLVLAIACSPFRYDKALGKKALRHTVIIDAPVDSVFAYLGNSANAKYWSIYVDHIVPLNADKVKDGQPGSQRRCYTRADETQEMWDEEILEVKPNQLRRLSCYNFQNFIVSAHNLQTEQQYKALGADKTQLSFVFYFSQEPSIFEWFNMAWSAHYTKYIFKRNMDNIKARTLNKVTNMG